MTNYHRVFLLGEMKMKITNQQLRQIIKEELEIVLESLAGNMMRSKISNKRDVQADQAFHDRRDKHQEFSPGKSIYKGLAGGSIASIEQDPNIPPEHKKKLIALFKSGPEGRKQAKELMTAMGYGVEPEYETVRGPFDQPRSFQDEPETHYIGNSIGGDTFTYDEKDPNQYGKYKIFEKRRKK